ncbi:MAG: DUF1295 domain-containing protein, partial [Proteobacteria bacterium]|nr:DUF1295 domain-containing protein [Pseudomonadota bacterium]
MLAALAINAVAILLLMVLLAGVAARIGDVSFIDAVWGGGMAVLAVVTWVQAGRPDGRGWAIMLMAAIWGIRLAAHLYTRWRAHGEDPRYARMLGKAREQGRYGRKALTRVFLPQAVLLYVTCLPAQLGVLAGGQPAGPLAVAGAALWLLGMVFETLGDWQLTRFRADPANKGKVLD